jgi:hypothetical protein
MWRWGWKKIKIKCVLNRSNLAGTKFLIFDIAPHIGLEKNTLVGFIKKTKFGSYYA